MFSKTQGYLSVTSEQSYDFSGEFYRRKTKSFQFLQKETPILGIFKKRVAHAFRPHISKNSKIVNFRDKILIFFPVKAEMLLFSNLTSGGHQGGHGTIYFDLKF